MSKLLVYIAFVSILFTSSCSGDYKETEEIIRRAGSLVEYYPDSTLILLDSIRNPYELNSEQYNKYYLLKVQAKDKSYKDISADTLIFEVRDFFKKENDLENLALSGFYTGRVFQEQGKLENAMRAYLEAEVIANQRKNYSLTGLINFFIGDLNYNKQLFDEAIFYFKQATSNFSNEEGKYRNGIVSYNQIGNCFLLKNMPDSAFTYYGNGMQLARLYNDSTELVNIMQNIGVAFTKMRNLSQAEIALHEALSLCEDDKQKARIYLNLAKLYHAENLNDSAFFYSNLSLKMSNEDISLQASNYKLLSKIEEESGNYQQGLIYHELYTRNLALVLKQKEDLDILNVQRKYNFELISNANNKLLIERQWIIIAFLLFTFIMFFLFYRNRVQNKKALWKATQQTYQLKNMIQKKDENNINKNNKLRKILFQQLDTLKKITLLESYLREEEKEKGREMLKKVNNIIYGHDNYFDWNVFYQPVNALYDDYLNKLQKMYPGLKDAEILICCLSKAGLDNTEISLLVKSTPNAIQKKKSVIRKKTGMKEQESFIKQLDELIK